MELVGPLFPQSAGANSDDDDLPPFRYLNGVVKETETVTSNKVYNLVLTNETSINEQLLRFLQFLSIPAFPRTTSLSGRPVSAPNAPVASAASSTATTVKVTPDSATPVRSVPAVEDAKSDDVKAGTPGMMTASPQELELPADSDTPRK